MLARVADQPAIGGLLNSGPATRDQLDYQHDNRYHEKNVDEAAHGVRTYQSK
jgi:hypothetical protein